MASTKAAGPGRTGWEYAEALEWLYARQALGIKLGLGKVEQLLDALGNPQDAFASIHVAGTNGKGSVTRMLAETLQRAGHRTGATTSPHLVSFTERIQVDGQAISRDEVAAGLWRIRPHVEDLDREGQPPTFFEVVTALAFCFFRDAGVQWAVVETGMGGRLDATNVLTPRLTIITNVDLDHQEHLGPTIAQIAWEKSGILKPGVPCVTAATGEALLVLKARSHEERVPMSIVGGDYTVVPDTQLLLLRPTGEARYEVGLAGPHQHTNAALVVAAADALRKQGVDIPERALREGLRQATNPGRLESFIHEGMQVLVDGAHNPAAALALRRHLAATDWRGFDLVVGFCADKQWQECLGQWAPIAARIWAVPLRTPRTLDAQAIVRHAHAEGWQAAAARDVAQALAHSRAAGASKVLVAGSLFLAGEARAHLTGEPLEEVRGTQ